MLIALDTSREQQQRLVVDASHELRTPLTAVRTNIDFLGHATTLDAEQRAQLIAETRLELDELTNLVSEMVELATDVRSEEPVEPVTAGRGGRRRRGAVPAPDRHTRSWSTPTAPVSSRAGGRCSTAPSPTWSTTR